MPFRAPTSLFEDDPQDRVVPGASVPALHGEASSLSPHIGDREPLDVHPTDGVDEHWVETR